MTASPHPVVLLSVRSPHVERLLDGSKTVEFRRRTWNVPDGSTAILYASRNRRAIVGALTVTSTEVGSRTALWNSHGKRSGLTRNEYREYFSGASVAVAISVGAVRALDQPLALSRASSSHACVPCAAELPVHGPRGAWCRPEWGTICAPRPGRLGWRPEVTEPDLGEVSAPLMSAG